MNSQQEKLLLERNTELEHELAAKNRELEIEASLERVRLKAMAMEKSEDLANAVAIVFGELDKLNMGMLRCGIGILNKENKSVNVWTTTKSDRNLPVQISGDESMESHPLLQGAFNAWLKQEDFSYVLRGNDLTDYYKAQTLANFKLPDSQSLLTADDDLRQYYFLATFKAGGLFAFRETPFPDEAKIVMKRFADVFNLTYTRFTDLKQAEAQARESQIEASLERVRSSSLAMHKSDELKDVVKVVFENLRSLGLKKIDAVNINILHKGSKEFDLWLAAAEQEYTRNFRLPYLDHPIANDFFTALEKGETLHKKIYAYKQKNEYFNYMFENSDNKYLPEERKALILNGTAYSVSAAIGDHSSIFVHNYNGESLSDEDDEILIRFSKVFDQAYTRYLDLHKAELLIKEVVKQASLDRIRGQVASMRSTEDLQRIPPLIWQELSKLNISFRRCGIFIMDETESIIKAYLSTPDGRPLGVLHLPFSSDEVTARTVDYWRRKEIFRHHWNKDEFVQWMQALVDQGQLKDIQTFQGGTFAPESLDLHGVPFMQGMLYIGSVQPLSPYELDLVKSLAETFSVAYARYEDFSKLEKAKHSVEVALAELKATQSQLIQSEKMASLGQLTAGIAHEIQNPLNFVNNFSEVNKELVEEAKIKTSLSAGQAGKLKTEELGQLLNDIAENEEKINYHGKRASAIVKGMLQHSRKSTGQKEPTDINALCDEYLRLSYHGLKAKDKSFNADFKTDFDEHIGKINIVAQDVGRVLLNLFNNAFYAVSEKQKTADENYKPLVTVATKSPSPLERGWGEVEIRVADNGNGIPKEIVDKIFQPFFTTKPTGQGTGLGLSLSYDIIKAHGGEIKVEAEKGEGAEFVIQLPRY
jgi:signal transduction histidine kinase